jgi:hypothetical protein
MLEPIVKLFEIGGASYVFVFLVSLAVHLSYRGKPPPKIKGNYILDSLCAVFCTIICSVTVFPWPSHCFESSYGMAPGMGFIPTNTSTSPNAILQCTRCPPCVSIPASFSKETNFGPNELAKGGLSPEDIYTPVTICCHGVLISGRFPQECTLYGVVIPALRKTLTSFSANSFPSTSVGYAITHTVRPENGLRLSEIRTWSSSESDLGAICVSNAIIFACCELLIPSSNTNRKIVQTASTAIPPTTNQNATRWTEGGYFGLSNIIPPPTAILASTARDNSVTWGQKGSKSPERNLLTYVSIAAMLGWSIVSLAAITQLGRSLIALWRERHPKGQS